jgi:hypothetical protein
VRTFFHADEPEAIAPRCIRVESDPVVGHLHVQMSVVGEAHRDRMRVAMTGGIQHSLADDPQESLAPGRVDLHSLGN